MPRRLVREASADYPVVLIAAYVLLSFSVIPVPIQGLWPPLIAGVLPSVALVIAEAALLRDRAGAL